MRDLIKDTLQMKSRIEGEKTKPPSGLKTSNLLVVRLCSTIFYELSI